MSLILSGTDGLSDVDGSAATPAIRGTDANTGIFFPAADTIAFSEGGAEVMRINSSGNLLVGTTTAATGALLTVNGAIKGATTSGTAVASTSGTSIDFTGIPNWVKRITVLFNGTSTNGSSDILVRTGSGSVSSTNYSSVLAYWSNTSTAVVATNATGFRAIATSPGQLWSGAMVISLVNSATNAWSETASFSDGTTYLVTGSGGNTLSGVLDQVRITTVNGTDTFDAGLVNILYEA